MRKGKRSNQQVDYLYLSPQGHVLKTRPAIQAYIAAYPKLYPAESKFEPLEHVEVGMPFASGEDYVKKEEGKGTKKRLDDELFGKAIRTSKGCRRT